MTTDVQPYLSGNFAPTHDEIDADCTEVEGRIPDDLAGSFLRIGPNNQFEPIAPERYHLFDGDGMVHRVAFAGGRARYDNRFVRTAGFERERAAGKALWGGFRDLMDMPRPEDMPIKNVANTALVWHAGKLLALWEAGSPHRLRPADLATLGEERFEDKWRGAFTAHPTIDPRSGEMICFGYSPFPPYVHYGVIDRKGHLVHEASIDLPRPVMIHDIAITPHYSLILDMPVTFDLQRALAGGMAYDWDPSNGARIGLLPRFGGNGDVRWFEVETGYVFHVFNAWEEGDVVVLDACRSNSTRILTESGLSADEVQARHHQYRFHLPSGRVEERRVGDTALEFSRINEGYVGVENRFAYASRFCPDPDAGPLFDAVLKFDRQGEQWTTVDLGPSVYTQEFVFAPRASRRSEDDGYVIGIVRDEKRERSECWILDAQRFAEGPVARVRIPARVPYGFHSHWVSAEQIASAAR